MNATIIRISASCILAIAAFSANIGQASASGTAIGGAIGTWANDSDEESSDSGPTLTTRCVVPGSNKTVRC